MRSRLGLTVVCWWLALTTIGCTFMPVTRIISSTTTPMPPLSTPTPKLQTPMLTLTTTDRPATPPTPTPETVPPPDGVNEGNTAIDFTLSTLQDDPATLSDLRGQVVLLNFWAVWCGYCRVEMPDLQAAYDQFKGQGFVVLGIDIRESAEQVKPFVEKLGVTFPILLDQDGQVALGYRIRGIPTSILIDREGVIRVVRVGPLTQEEVVKLLAEMEIE